MSEQYTSTYIEQLGAQRRRKTAAQRRDAEMLGVPIHVHNRWVHTHEVALGTVKRALAAGATIDDIDLAIAAAKREGQNPNNALLLATLPGRNIRVHSKRRVEHKGQPPAVR